MTPFEGDDLLEFEGDNKITTTQFFIKGYEPSTYKFDGTRKEMHVFMEIISDKAEQFHWNNILYIEDDDDIPRSIIYDPEMITFKNMLKNVREYQDKFERRAQNARMMYYYIIDSLTPHFKGLIMQHTYDFTLYGHRNGPMLLKKIHTLVTEEETTETHRVVKTNKYTGYTTLSDTGCIHQEKKQKTSNYNTWA
jgi:hypothetical protein